MQLPRDYTDKGKGPYGNGTLLESICISRDIKPKPDAFVTLNHFVRSLRNRTWNERAIHPIFASRSSANVLPTWETWPVSFMVCSARH